MRDAYLREVKLAILNAPFEEGGWERAVQSVVEATGAKGGHLLGMGGPMVLPLNLLAGDLGGIDRFIGNAHLHGSVNWRVGVTNMSAGIQHEAHYDEYRKIQRTADYDDAASDLDIQYGCQAVLMSDSTNFLGLALMRGWRQGRSGAESLARFQSLIRPLEQSVRVQLALDGEAAEMMIGGTAGLSGATILLDRHGALCAMTPAAEEAFADGGPARLVGLSVQLCDRRADSGFQAALARLLAADGPSGPKLHQMTVGVQHDGRWRVIAVRLPARSHGLGFDPHLAVTFRRLHDGRGAMQAEGART